MRHKQTTIREWYWWYVELGKGHLLSVNSPDKYVKRLMRAAVRYGWDCPVNVAHGKLGPHERTFLEEYERQRMAFMVEWTQRKRELLQEDQAVNG